MKVILFFVFMIVSDFVFSQKNDYKGLALSVGSSYLELKDEFNHGLVFRGPDVRLNFEYRNIDTLHYFSYHFIFGGGGKTTRGTWAGTWHLTPINCHYSWILSHKAQNRHYLGPYFNAAFNIQNYPELHAGPILWLTNYELGISFNSFITFKNKTIELSFQNSLLALNSRPSFERDPYFFSKKIIENFSDIHSNMTLNSIGKYSQSTFSTSYYFNGIKRNKSISYTFNFIRYYNPPYFYQIYHQISYKLYLNKH